MFSAKHFVKHFCLSLGNTGLLTYEKLLNWSNIPAIIRQFLSPAIAGMKLPDCRIHYVSIAGLFQLNVGEGMDRRNSRKI